MFDTLKLSDLAKRQCVILRKPSSTRPSVWLVEENSIRAIVKDFSTNRFLFRNTIGRFLVWREAKAYKKMNGLRGVPVLYRVIGGLALVIEDIPGIDLEEAEHETKLPDGFFDALKKVVDSFHERGVAHCDLKRAPNILVGHDGNPYVIDWAAAIFRNECLVPPFNLIYRRFLLDDYNAITKRKMRLSPELVTPEERTLYDHRSWPERAIRGFRDRLRGFIQKVV